MLINVSIQEIIVQTEISEYVTERDSRKLSDSNKNSFIFHERFKK